MFQQCLDGIAAGIVPGMAMFLCVLGFNLLGDALRDAYDPRAIRIGIPRDTEAPALARPV